MISCLGRFENSQRPILFDGHLGVKFMQRMDGNPANFRKKSPAQPQKTQVKTV